MMEGVDLSFAVSWGVEKRGKERTEESGRLLFIQFFLGRKFSSHKRLCGFIPHGVIILL